MKSRLSKKWWRTYKESINNGTIKNIIISHKSRRLSFDLMLWLTSTLSLWHLSSVSYDHIFQYTFEKIKYINIVLDLGVNIELAFFVSSLLSFNCDDLRTTCMGHNLSFHTRTKHIVLNYHFIHKQVHIGMTDLVRWIQITLSFKLSLIQLYKRFNFCNLQVFKANI